MQRRSPASDVRATAFSADYASNIYMPNTVLYPTEKGNPGRRYTDPELGELIQGNAAIVDYSMTVMTWSTTTGVLTDVIMPKIKLREGVQRVEGKRFEYDIVPTTAVPPRGTVRFMSKRESGFSLAIGQKGIGSKFEGRALRSAYGPQLLAMEIQAIAESINLGMAWNTAINLVNAGFRYEYSADKGTDYNMNKGQAMAAEINHWCALGVDPARINVGISRIVQEKPDLNTLLVPEDFTLYMNEASLRGQYQPPSERSIVKYAFRDGRIVEIETADKIVTIMSLNSGIDVYQMPSFRIGKTTVQPLSTVSRIGEVYPMRGYLDAEGKRYLKSSLDIYVYSEPDDKLVKLKFDDMLLRGAIWDHGSSNSWDSRLRKTLEITNKRIANPKAVTDKFLYEQPQFPFTRVNKKSGLPNQLTLPTFVGNLDEIHLDNSDFTDAVQSVVSQVTANGMVLADASDDIALINDLRQRIEEEPYNADYFAAVAKLNINRSVSVGVDGRATFVGQVTDQRRVRAHGGTRAIVEWTPNRVGGLDVPTEYVPAGCWSAAGLRTIADTPNHPLAAEARRAYLFMSKLASRAREILQSSAVFHMDEMPVNMPKDDEVELAMRACFGPRVPLFLAAPLGLVSASKARTEALRGPIGGSKRGSSGGSSSPAIKRIYIGPMVAENKDVQILTSGSSQLGDIIARTMSDLEHANTLIAWKSPSGAVFVLPMEISQLLTTVRDGKIYDPALFVTTLFGDLYNDFVNKIGILMDTLSVPSNEKDKKKEQLMGTMRDILIRQSSNLDERRVQTGARMLKYVTAKNSLPEIEAAFGILNGSDTTAAKNAIKDFNIIADDTELIHTGIATVRKAEAKVTGPAASHEAQRTFASLINFSGLLKDHLEQRRRISPGASFDRTYINLVPDHPPEIVEVLKKLGYTEFDANGLNGTQVGVQVQELITELAGVVAKSNPPIIQSVAFDAEAERAPSTVDLIGATYYRTPLNMTLELLVSSARVDLPWILPGDHNESFNTPHRPNQLHAQPGDLGDEADYLNEKVYNLPHYAQSKGIPPSTIRHWSDAGVLSRVAHANGHYNTTISSASSLSLTSRGPIRSRGILDQADTFMYGRDGPSTGPTVVVPQQAPKEFDFTNGYMEERLRFVTGEWSNNFVRRFCGLAYCFVPADYGEGIRSMISQNVMPPFGILGWRLRSDHQTASLVLVVAGVKTGANFYNGAHLDWAKDATRDVYQLRAVITTDPHVIRPENIRFIHNVMPLGYNGGHNGAIVSSEEEIYGNRIQIRQPSFISTICSLNMLKRKSSPISIVNRPPAQIERVGGGVLEVDWDRQYFPGSLHYCEHVYPRIYGSAVMPDERALAAASQSLAYRAAPLENHIAFDGYHVGYDYKKEHYFIENLGNGHRNSRRLNLPGARAYLNKETSVLPPEKHIQDFLLV